MAQAILAQALFDWQVVAPLALQPSTSVRTAAASNTFLLLPMSLSLRTSGAIGGYVPTGVVGTTSPIYGGSMSMPMLAPTTYGSVVAPMMSARALTSSYVPQVVAPTTVPVTTAVAPMAVPVTTAVAPIARSYSIPTRYVEEVPIMPRREFGRESVRDISREELIASGRLKEEASYGRAYADDYYRPSYADDYYRPSYADTYYRPSSPLRASYGSLPASPRSYAGGIPYAGYGGYSYDYGYAPPASYGSVALGSGVLRSGNLGYGGPVAVI